jgi:hypothetical protein
LIINKVSEIQIFSGFNNVVSVNAIEVGVKSMAGKVFKSCNSTSLHEYGFSLEVQDNTNSNKHI